MTNPVSSLNNLKNGASLSLMYTVEVNVFSAAKAFIGVGTATESTLTAANVAASEKVLGIVGTFVDELKAKTAAEKKRVEDAEGVQWKANFTLFMHKHMGFPKFRMVRDLPELQNFVTNELAFAEQQPQGEFHFLGMDSEGHRSSSAKYIQLAGHSTTVVVFLSEEAIEILRPLFSAVQIKMVVFDAAREFQKLPPSLNVRHVDDLYDLQKLAKSVMGKVPSLENFTSFLLKYDQGTLVKMANLHPAISYYDPFETNSALPDELQYYAAVDALATLWAFHECRKLIGENPSTYPNAHAFD
jgi:hypothetical protein